MKARFDIGRSIRRPVTQRATRQLFWQAVDDPQTGAACAEHQDLWEGYMRGELTKEEFEEKRKEVKMRLWFATYQATFTDHYKHNETAEDSHLTFFDVDHREDSRELYAQYIMGHEREWGIVLVELSASGHGLHVVFARPEGMTNQQAQQWMSEQLGGIEYDKGTHELARATYMVTREYILYIDEPRLFGEEELEAAVVGRMEEEGKNESDGSDGSDGVVEPSEMALRAFDLFLERSGLGLAAITGVGTRHNSLKMLLPDLGQMMSEGELMGVLAQKMPGYVNEKDCRKLVHDFYAKYIDTNRPLSVAQKEVFKTITARGSKETLAEAEPPMPRRLPKLIQLLISKEPQTYHPTVANAVFPSLAAHFVGVNFPYIDNTLREATFMCCTIAPMSSGKSCVDRPVEHILKDIRERDEMNINRENEWKQQCKTRGSNKEKPRRPEGLCIQVMDSDMTNAAFVQKLVDAGGKYLYTIVDEVELFYQLKTSGNKSVGKIFRLAFDNKPYGQVRVGVDSVSGSMPLRWNWNASTTVQQGQQFFRSMKADGTLSRINFTTIKAERGMDIPIHGIYDEQFDADLKPYIDRLNAASGTIDCPQARRLVKRMLKENAEIADLSDDELYERLSFRAVILAWLKAMTLYVAEGQWSKQIEEFAVWSMHYDMWCKMMFFGEEMRQQMQGEIVKMKRGPMNMLSLLPERFTEREALHVRLSNGRDDRVQPMLNTWRSRGYVVMDAATGEYVKAGAWRKNS